MEKGGLICMLVLVCAVISSSGEMFLEQGVYVLNMSSSTSPSESGKMLISLSKSMFANSEVGVRVLSCSVPSGSVCAFNLEWTIRLSDCDGVYTYLFNNAANETQRQQLISQMYTLPKCFYMEEEDTISYVQSAAMDRNPQFTVIEDVVVKPETLKDLNQTGWSCSTRNVNSTVCNKDICGVSAESKLKQGSTSSGEGAPESVKEDPQSANTEDDTESLDNSGGEKSANTDTKLGKAESQDTDSPVGGGSLESLKEDNTETDGDTNSEKAESGKDDTKGGSNTGSKRKREAANPEEGQKEPEDPPAETEQEQPEESPGDTKKKQPEESPGDTKKKQKEASPAELVKYRVVHTSGKDGRFIFILAMETEVKDLEVTLKIEMKSPSGYLSATQYPLLPFYGTMCAVYTILGLVWMILLFRQWRDLLRIQYWIAVVILLGLIEKAAFVAEFDRHNKTGESSNAGVFIAEELSVLKRTTARMLVIIVSLGYGITRPRLGRDLNWVLGAGSLFFFLSSLEVYFRITQNRTNNFISLIPLSVLDAILCWWIFRSLVDTTRTLRLRRNLVKLWLYRHLTNALIFCVVAAIIFLLWSLKVHRMNNCVKVWNELWLDDGYWHILFCVILLVIMILLRPTANNQRYAYSVLSDAADDDESKEPMMNDAFESVKMRNVQSSKTSGQDRREEDDLKWVEDNIPAAVADAALGAFDDSEEELITSMERSKME